ncbi:hypothetical protein F5I97DRAFT_1829058 [Phlebopus sp. FC_14]|nr:hypothetical protein F5I97DRAFT_1829058 [Phlebopus sp. FC_14]
MRFAPVLVALSTVLAPASASLSMRQSVPSCVTTCLADASTGGCSSTDYTCLCQSQTFISSMISCAEATCSASDLQSAESLAETICLSVGVTVSIPTLTPTATSPTATSSSTSSTTPTPSTGAATSNGINALTGAAMAVALAAVL